MLGIIISERDVSSVRFLRQTGFEIALLFLMHLGLHDENPFIILRIIYFFNNLVIMWCSKMSFILLHVYFNLFTVNITQFKPGVAKLYSINYLSIYLSKQHDIQKNCEQMQTVLQGSK